MKRNNRTLWVLSILCFLAGIPAFGGDSGARFSGISGVVEVRPDALPDEWKFAKFDTVLNIGDHVRTGDESSAILSFSDMSTFVLKPGSEIVIATPPEKDNKIKLVSGSIWVNVKKMMKDGSMEIEMTQVVAGIKGTNFTCSSSKGEDRIQVLRGELEATIRATQEKIPLKEGEVLIVKKGGKVERSDCEPTQIQNEWKKELGEVSAPIELNEVPETIKNLMQIESEGFKELALEFKRLSLAEKVTEKEEISFRKDCERFLGLLLEHQNMFSSLFAKLDRAQNTEKLLESAFALINNYRKMLSSAQTSRQSYQDEIQKMLKVKLADEKETAKTTIPTDSSEIDQLISEITQEFNNIDSLILELNANTTDLSQDWFKSAFDRTNQSIYRLSDFSTKVADFLEKYPDNSPLKSISKQITDYQTKLGSLIKSLRERENDKTASPEDSSEVDQLISEIIAEFENIDSLISELNANPTGLSQSWFKLASDRANQSINRLSDFSLKVADFLEKYPENSSLKSISKQISDYQTKLGNFSKSLVVMEVDPNVITEMIQNEETMSEAIFNLKKDLDGYNSSSQSSQVLFSQLQSSLRILNNFSQARRNFLRNQRLYETTMKSISGQKYKTKEQEELELAFERISNTYYQLGIVVEQLQARLRDLENQNSPFLK